MAYGSLKTIRVSVNAAILILIIVSFVTGCGISSAIKETNTKIQSAIDSFDRAIATLGQESADWRVVMYDLEKEIAEDVRSTIRTEIENLTRSAILTASAEIRCNADFIRVRLERELIRIRNSFAIEINAQLDRFPSSNYSIPLLEEIPVEPVICSIVPSAVDLSLDPVRRPKIDIFGYDLLSRPISVGLMSHGSLTLNNPIGLTDFKAIIKAQPRSIGADKIITDAFVLAEPSKRIRRDITNALSIISEYHAVLDLTESGVEIMPNAQEIVLSWNDQIKSEIPILVHQQILQCETRTKTIYPGSKSLKPPALDDNICDGKPDKDFYGHGPCVRFNMRLNLDSERKKLTASYSMNAWECPDDFDKYRNDCTEVYGSGSVVLYTAQDNEKILSFDVQSAVFDQYIDNDDEDDFSYFGGTEPIDKLEYVGDTDGDEAGSRTGVKMTFRRINMQIESCEFK